MIKLPITIEDVSDESVELADGNTRLALLNHDDDGWAGIERGIELTKAIAKEFGIEVVDRQGIV